MIDRRLRASKDRLLVPAARHLSVRVAPGWFTAASLAGGVGAGIAAASGAAWLAAALWLAGRACDGLDGAIARARGRQSDLGGYLDMVGDTIGYAAVPIGIAAGADEQVVWAWCAVLLATFYVNTISWTYLAAVAEKRGEGAAATGEHTAIHMPAGLVEGTETIALFVVMILDHGRAATWFAVMAVLVVVTIGQRVQWAWRRLT